MNQSDALMGALHLLREEIGGIRKSLERIESGLEEVCAAVPTPNTPDSTEARDPGPATSPPSWSLESENPALESPTPTDSMEAPDSALATPLAPPPSSVSDTPGIDDLLGGVFAVQTGSSPAPPGEPASASSNSGATPSDEELELLLANRVAAPSPLVPTTGPRKPPPEISHAPAAARLEDDPDRFDLSVNALEEIFGTDKER